MKDFQIYPSDKIKSITSGGGGGWMEWLYRFIASVCGITLLVAGWKGLKEMAIQSLFRMPEVPALGEADYGMSMVGTIGELIEREALSGKSMAVWSGTKKRLHGLPFRWRVSADWFLLPEKGVSIAATANEAADYEYILSPWQLGNQLDGTGRKIDLVADDNRVWLYRITTEEGVEE